MYPMFCCVYNPRSYGEKVQAPLKFRHSCVESGQDISRYGYKYKLLSLYFCLLILLLQISCRLDEHKMTTYTWSMWKIIIYNLFSLLLFQYELQRIDFDEAVSSIQGSKDIPAVSAVRILLRKLLFFHSNSKDTQRLVRKKFSTLHTFCTVSNWRYMYNI